MKRTLAILLALAALLTFAACTGGAPSTRTGTGSSRRPTAPGAIVQPSSSTQNAPTSPTLSLRNGVGFTAGPRVDAVRQCGDTAFVPVVANEEGAAGHGSLVLRFTNRLPQPCTLTGYPGVDALNGSQTVLAHAARTLRGMAGGANAVTTVTVAPGATASALLEWSTVPTGTATCAYASILNVTAANTRASSEIPATVSSCELQVHPTVVGATGSS